VAYSCFSVGRRIWSAVDFHLDDCPTQHHLLKKNTTDFQPKETASKLYNDTAMYVTLFLTLCCRGYRASHLTFKFTSFSNCSTALENEKQLANYYANTVWFTWMISWYSLNSSRGA
jgi:hypothetical protein